HGAHLRSVYVKTDPAAIKRHRHMGPGIERRTAVAAYRGIGPRLAVRIRYGAVRPSEEGVLIVLVDQAARIVHSGINPGRQGEALARNAQAWRIRRGTGLRCSAE